MMFFCELYKCTSGIISVKILKINGYEYFKIHIGLFYTQREIFSQKQILKYSRSYSTIIFGIDQGFIVNQIVSVNFRR